ncbi:U-box domain-containing protein 7 [Tripterygium wilfordii]|uniref:U-box domain-containing protein 7 n=1 Tax=Tripterygium wilfordii TaxID=458696 RepID=A0A7J7C4W2_TRIWF|nr:U-box domain-containing protein 7 [Tripterygium wilfordii]KAF5729164.1 U-box domain-containing protein 7 [Tripterygium wilfordii]
MSNPSSHIPVRSRSSYISLPFFGRIKRFLRSKAARKLYESKVQFDKPRFEVVSSRVEAEMEDDSVLLQRSVKRLHFGSCEEKERAAMEIERLARDDVKTRKLMAELGVIPVLVSMAASGKVNRRRVAVKALIELANGTYTNKALIVEAGLLSKLPRNVDVLDNSTQQDFAELLSSLSSLANTQFALNTPEILPFVMNILESDSRIETKEPCLGVLYNLSAVLENAGSLVSNGVVHTLLRLSSVKDLSEKALATLGHLVVTLMGKKAMEDSELVPESLIEILTWEDKPKCQELSAYILMILAHQSSVQRDKMAKSGIVPVLIEVSLLGSALTQKRAMKLLQWFKDERQVKMGPHSGPQTAGRVVIGSPVNDRVGQEGRKLMKNLVKQSLYKNMEMITRRASAAGECSKVKALVISTSSKSLPY